MKKMSSLSDRIADLKKTMSVYKPTEFWPSGSPILDKLWGGGVPKGCFIEIFSEEGIGKSTIALHIAENILFSDPKTRILYLDFEKGVHTSLLSGIGNLPKYHEEERFYLLRPGTYEEGDDAIRSLLPDINVVVLDSFTAMVPAKVANLEEGMMDVTKEPAFKARMDSNFCGRYKGHAEQLGVTFIFISQMRTKLSFMPGRTRIDSAGGLAMRFYADIRMYMLRGQNIENSDKKIVGTDVCLETVKNKFTAPLVKSVTSVIFGKGISNVRTYRLFLENEGAITQAGPFYTMTLPGKEPVKVQGQIKLEELIVEMEEPVMAYLKEKGHL